MRRFALCAFAVLAVGLMLAPGALASTGVKYAVPLSTRHSDLAPAPAMRLGADPVFSISGVVRNFDGSSAAMAYVDWGWWKTTGDYRVNYGYGGSSEPTGSTGAFSLPSVASNSSVRANSDDLRVSYDPYNQPDGPVLLLLDSTANDFSVDNNGTLPSPFSYALQPSEVQVTFTGLSSALESGQPEVWTAGTLGSAETSVPLTNGTGTAFVMPSSFNDVVAGFYTAQGALTTETQWQGSDTAVVAGVPDTTPVSLDWSQAQHAALAGPLCQHSGKPGSIARLVLHGWPQSEQAGFTMESNTQGWIYPQALFTSTGINETHTEQLQIPPKAVVDWYQMHVYRSDVGDPNGILDLYDYYQVCTFKASASTIRHGKSVRLSGMVPAAAGKVTLYSTIHKVSGQPATLAAKGWTKLGTYKVASRKFATGLLHPKRTTYYVVEYRGYAFTAFTSVIKVTVH